MILLVITGITDPCRKYEKYDAPPRSVVDERMRKIRLRWTISFFCTCLFCLGYAMTVNITWALDETVVMTETCDVITKYFDNGCSEQFIRSKDKVKHSVTKRLGIIVPDEAQIILEHKRKNQYFGIDVWPFGDDPTSNKRKEMNAYIVNYFILDYWHLLICRIMYSKLGMFY